MSIEFGKEVIEAEITALKGLLPLLDESFEKALSLIMDTQGSVIVSGVGKAGLIGSKISATLASTGTPSFFLHPTEAVHGDLGRATDKDLVLALSNSGSSDEMIRLLPILKRIGTPIISITGNMKSELALHADVSLSIGKIEEACPLKLAPSASTTAMLALGDALALCVQKKRNFTQEDYALFHPAGALGRKLMPVADVMRKGDRCAMVSPQTSVRETISATTEAVCGTAVVVDANQKVLGVFTDGDLRRHLDNPKNSLDDPVEKSMTQSPLVIVQDKLLSEALHLLEDRGSSLPVTDQNGSCVGLLDIKDLLRMGLF